MNKILQLFSLFFAISLTTVAQTPTFFNTNLAGGGNAFPLNNSTTSRKVQWFIPAGSLGAVPGGNQITDVYFQAGSAATRTYPIINIRMKAGTGTGLTGVAAGPIEPGMNLVYTAVNQTLTTTVGGWIKFTLNTPWVYDPALPLIVELEHNATSGTGPTLYQYTNIPGPGNGRQWADYNAATLTSIGANQVNFGIDVSPAGPCTSPPIAGTSTSNPAGSVCFGTSVQLNLTGNTGGIGQTYEWESSANIGGPYTSITGLLATPAHTITATSTLYYRCAVTCSGNTQYSTPVLLTVSPGFPGGTYTINSTLPTGGTNFQTFNAAIAALSCGITGPIILNVVAGTGPYNEQVTIPQIGGASALNNITINGNNNVLTFAANATDRHTLGLNGADFFTFNNLVINGTDATNALSCHLWNNADNNTFNACTFNCNANTTATTTVPFSISGSPNVATTQGVSGSGNLINECIINGGYYNTCIVGNSAGANTGNQLINCEVKDFYFYGVYVYYQNGAIIRGNLIHRPARTTLSTFYGIYILTGCTNTLVEKNRIRNPFAQNLVSTSTAYGIYSSIDGTLGNENKYYNNIISNMESNGIVYGMYLIGADYVKVYHNTVSLDHAGATAGTTYGIYNSGTLGGIDIRNNIVSITRGGSGTKYGLYYTFAGTQSNKNVIYINSPAGLNYTGYFGAAQATLANWQAVNGNAFDQQSSAANPIYNNPAIQDYTPTELSFNNLGDPVGVTDDIVNFTRSLVTPDPGAYEYANSNIDLSITTLVAPDNSGCYGANQDVTVTVLNSGLLTMDFSVTPATISCDITGALNTTLNATISSGTLAPNTAMNFTFPTQINMNTNGNYTFAPAITVAGDANPGNNALNPPVTRIVGISPGVITSSLPEICVSGTPTFTVTGSTGGARQWRISEISPSGPWTNVGAGLTTYTPALPITQTTYVSVLMTCNGISDSSSFTLNVNNPSIISTVPDTICGPATATLEATTQVGNNIKWYNVPSGGSPLFTGNIFTTPVLNATTTYYAEPLSGAGGIDSLALPLANGTTSGVYHNMFLVKALNGLTVTAMKIKCLLAVGTLSTWEVYYRPDNYQLIPGANLSPAGWINLGTYSTASLGSGNYTTIMLNQNINIPANQTYSFYVAPAAGTTHQYATNAAGVLTGNNIDMEIYAGHRGSALFNLATASGQAIVRVVYNKGCVGNRVPVTAEVNPAPIITATPNAATLCEGTSLTLSGGGAGAGGNYVWTGGVTDGVPFNVLASNIYTVTGTTATGCSNTATATITVNPVVTGTATVSPNPICLGESATFSATVPTVCAGNLTNFAGYYAPVNWSVVNVNSNGSVNTLGAPTSIVITSGSNLSNNPGTTGYQKTIGCAGTITFNWAYNHPDAFGSIFDYPRYTINGGAPITFTSFTIGGSNIQNGIQNIAVNAGDIVQIQGYTIDNDPTPCSITIANFSAPAEPVGGTASFWDAPTGGVNVGNSPYTTTPVLAGNLTYYAEYTALNGCINTVRTPVTLAVNSLPAVMATASPSTICIGENTNLSASGANNYSWNPGGLLGANHIVNPMANTTYTVLGTDGNGCSATSAVFITVNGLPNVTATPSTQTLCENGMATVAGGGAVSYVWTGGITDNTPFAVTMSNVYTVTGTDGNGCENTATAEVIMNAAPIISAMATPSTTCNQTSVVPSATATGAMPITIAWSGGLINNTPFIAVANGTYTVTATDNNTCTATTTVLVTVNPASGTLAPATSNQSQDHGDDFDINYYDASCDLIATVDDGAGGNILGLTTATVNVMANAGTHNGQPYVRRWYQITPTSNGAADVILYINQSDFDDYNAAVLPPYLPLPTTGNNADPNIANIRITKNDDAGLGNNPIVITPAVNWNGTYWELSFNTPSFSQFRVHSVNPMNIPLPATITQFSGVKMETNDKLVWSTSSEQNNAYFNLQHSTDGKTYSNIAKVNSKAPNGNSQVNLNYVSYNEKPVLGKNYYRLQQVDIDNNVTIHNEIVITNWGADGSVVSLYPNPTSDVLNIDLQAVKSQMTTVKVMDMSGRVVKQIDAKTVVGMNNIKVNLGEFANGMYTVQVLENNQLTYTGKVRLNK